VFESGSAVRFGAFEADLRTEELRKNGLKIKLEGQPLQILSLLLQRPGELVTREELKQALWPSDTFVDFDVSINAAVKRLRQALDDSAETPRFIETLPRRGYRFIYPVTGTPSAARAPSEWRRRRVALIASIVVLAISATWEVARIFERRNLAGMTSLAVLPLENLTGDAEQAFLVDGIHDDLITQMAQIGALTVVSRTSVLRYKDTKKAVPEIARELGVEGIIEGTVRRDGDRVRVTAQLIHAATDRHLWARSYERGPSELQLLPKQIAVDVAGALRIGLSQQEQAGLKPDKPVDPAVYTAYLKGTHHSTKWTHEGQWQAIRYFQQALDLDPSYAPAWAAMGNAYETLGSFAKGKELSREDAVARARAALERAVELDSTLRGAHQALARIARRNGDWEGAAREFQRAREVDPKWLGPETYLVATGRYDEAVAASGQTARTNPLDYSVQLVHGWTCFMAGRYDESIAQLKKTIQLDPNIHYAHYELAWNYMKKGMKAEAVAECDTAQALLRRKQPERSVVECGWVYAAAGRRREALEIANQMAAAKGPEIAAGTGEKKSLALAKIYDALGDRERALAYLSQSDNSAVPLRDNPFLSDQLKGDLRFQEIAGKQPGFPPPTGALAEVRAKAPPIAERR